MIKSEFPKRCGRGRGRQRAKAKVVNRIGGKASGGCAVRPVRKSSTSETLPAGMSEACWSWVGKKGQGHKRNVSTRIGRAPL